MNSMLRNFYYKIPRLFFVTDLGCWIHSMFFHIHTKWIVNILKHKWIFDKYFGHPMIHKTSPETDAMGVTAQVESTHYYAWVSSLIQKAQFLE